MASHTLPRQALVAAVSTEKSAYAVPSLTEVYEAHFKYVWRCMRSLGVDAAALDDAVQEVFLVVQRKLDAFDGGCELKTWLYAIVLRIARQHRTLAARNARRFEPHDASSPPESGGCFSQAYHADLRHEIEKNERLALAQRALSLIDDPKREVFVLACVEGMSAPEIAQVTGAPLNTVYSRLRAARHAFAEALESLQQPAATCAAPSAHSPAVATRNAP